jgi:alpha-L-fucosidase/lysophospholipase L1-like esterase
MTRVALLSAAALLGLVQISLGQAAVTDAPKPASQPDPDSLRRWQDMRFGMFIHWGPVSLKGTEIGWSRGDEVPVEEYDSLYHHFNPVRFNAKMWMKVAHAAGMKYVVFTTKHHDGFCMWDTKQTDYSIMRSPFGRDVVKELAAAAKAEGLAFGTYHSVCDWHHPDFPLTSPGGRTRRQSSDLDRYEQYLRSQVTELVTGYGPLLVMWFDVPQEFDQARGQGLIDLARGLQPDILVNNRSGAPGDYDTPEQRVGKFQNDRPWEPCMTVCQQWAWKPNDKLKSLKECLRTLIVCAGGDGNLLFNVGPMPDGRIEPRQVERLKEMGRWLDRYGQTIYGTRGGPFKPGRWGASTFKGNSIYVHLFDPHARQVTLPPIPKRIFASTILTGGAVRVKQTDQGIALNLAKARRQDISTIIELKLDGPASEIPPVGMPSDCLTAGRPAKASNVFQGMADYNAAKAVDDDEGTRWATDSGVHQAWLEVDLGSAVTFDRVAIREEYGRIRKFELQAQDGDVWKTFLTGTRAGEHYDARFRPVVARQVRLNILEATDGPTIWEFRLFGPTPTATQGVSPTATPMPQRSSDRPAVECTPRSGLPNFLAKATTGGQFKVAYLGGSITAQPGWRIKSLDWLNATYPKSRFSEINAAIGGTSSGLGVLRLEHDVLAARPDLLFVEFAVNDAGSEPWEIVKAMEGIVRKTWKALPDCDICFVYTFTESLLAELKAGRLNRSATAMDEVADHYGIPTLHLGLEAVRLEAEGKLRMKAPEVKGTQDEAWLGTKATVSPDGTIAFSSDGVHPYVDTGHQLYVEAIQRSFPAIRKASAKSGPHTLGAPLDAGNYENTQMLTLDRLAKEGPWTRLPADNDLAKRFADRLDSLWKAEPGGSLTFRFKGTAASFYDLMGPDCGGLEVVVDGKASRIRRIDGYCTYWRLSLAGAATGLDASQVHEVTVRVREEPLAKADILFEQNREDLAKNPAKYAALNWYVGALFVVGELVP